MGGILSPLFRVLSPIVQNEGSTIHCTNHQSLSSGLINYLTNGLWFSSSIGTEPLGEGGTWVNFSLVCVSSPSEPCPIVVYFVVSYRPHVSHFWKNVISATPSESLVYLCFNCFSFGRVALGFSVVGRCRHCLLIFLMSYRGSVMKLLHLN